MNTVPQDTNYLYLEVSRQVLISKYYFVAINLADAKLDFSQGLYFVFDKSGKLIMDRTAAWGKPRLVSFTPNLDRLLNANEK